MTAQERIAKTTRVIRNMLGLTNDRVAEVITDGGVPIKGETVRLRMTGERSWQADELEAFAVWLEVPVDLLFMEPEQAAITAIGTYHLLSRTDACLTGDNYPIAADVA